MLWRILVVADLFGGEIMPIPKALANYFGNGKHRSCPICASDETCCEARGTGSSPPFSRPEEFWRCESCRARWGVDDFPNDGPVYYLLFTEFNPAKISTAGLQQLSGLINLYLCNTEINDAGFLQLNIPDSVQHIDLSSTAITDASMNRLAQVLCLMSIDLSYTSVTDSGVLELKQLSNLKYLNVHATGVSPTALATLKSIFPKIQFESIYQGRKQRG